LGNGCSANDNISPEAIAAIYYDGADTNSLPNTQSGLSTTDLLNCANDDLSLTQPLCPVDLSNIIPEVTVTIEIDLVNNGTSWVWTMNNQTFRGNYNSPVLPQVHGGNMTFDPEWNVFDFGTNSSIRLVLINNIPQGAHPMHLHGHNFAVLNEGWGTWDNTIINPTNPQQRDVQILRSAIPPTNTTDLVQGFAVIQWANDNPGVWPLHCHIAWHASQGLFINVLERSADIQAATFPQSISDSCVAWDAFTAGTIVDQIDSGI